MKNIVSVAVRPDGCVGYFASPDQIPEGWTSSSPRDVTDVMASMRCSKEQALAVMNRHWSQSPARS